MNLFKFLFRVTIIGMMSVACKKENIKLDSQHNFIITSAASVSRPSVTRTKFGPDKMGNKSEIKNRIKRLEAQIIISKKKISLLSEAINENKNELVAFHIFNRIDKREEVLRALSAYREKLIQKDRLQGLLKNGLFVKPDREAPDTTKDQKSFDKLKLNYPSSIGQLFKEDKALTLSETNMMIAREQIKQARDKADLQEYYDNHVSLNDQYNHKNLYDERSLYRATVRKQEDELRSQYGLLQELGES